MKTLNCCGRLLDLSSPVVMGILNVTPDSFYDGGKFNEESDRRRKVEQMAADGAAIIDIGAISSRPGSSAVTEEEEWYRLRPVLRMMAGEFSSLIVSVDTFRASIAEKALGEGASMINDIYGGRADKKIMEVAARYQASYVLMHMQGDPLTMQQNPQYENVTFELLSYFISRIEEAGRSGLHDIVIDPGFGFGKNVSHNFTLLREFEQFKVLDKPLLAGISRKSMVTRTLDIKPDAALNGTTVLNTIALMKGANILRVHDVKEAVEAIKLVKTGMFENTSFPG